MLPKITDYWDATSGAIPLFAAELSALSAKKSARRESEIRAEVMEHVRVLPDDVLLRAASVAVDHLYMAASTVQYWDESIGRYLKCSASTFCGGLSQRGYRVEYIIDNTYDDYQRPRQLYPSWFGACGLVYLWPQALAESLMETDGLTETDYADSQGRYDGEARYLGDMLVQRCRDEKQHFVFLETDYRDGCLDVAMQGGKMPGVLAMFRNEAAVPGSHVSASFPDRKLTE